MEWEWEWGGDLRGGIGRRKLEADVEEAPSLPFLFPCTFFYFLFSIPPFPVPLSSSQFPFPFLFLNIRRFLSYLLQDE